MLLALAAGLCWGIGEVFTKSVLHTGRVGPLTAIAVRSTVALPLLWMAWAAAAALTRDGPRAPWDAPAPTLLKLVLGSGVVAGGLGMIAFYSALAAGEISRVKPIAFSVAPATAVLLGALVLGEPLTPRKLVAVGLILCGVILLTGSTPQATPAS
jgi:uncharacterized membrane protein